MKSDIHFDWEPGSNVSTLKSTPEIFGTIRENFSIPNDQYQFQRRYSPWVPRRLYAITPTGRFDPGLFYNIKKFILNKYPSKIITYSSNILRNVKPSYDISDLASLKLDLREYQKDIVHQCIKIGRGVVVLATAGGKTLTTACLIESIFKKVDTDSIEMFRCLVLVPTLNLVHQTCKDFLEYNISPSVCKWTGNEPLDSTANIIVANVGILQSSKTDKEWLKYIDLLIVDEVHMLRKGNKINKIIKSIITPNKFGLTGTLPESLLDQWNIFGLIGPKIYEKNSKSLRDEEYIGRVKAKIINIKYTNKPPVCKNPNEKYRKEIGFLTTNTFRNKVISKICSNLDNNRLIMVDHIEHGQLLYDSIIKTIGSENVYYIQGSVDISERERIRGLIETESQVTVIAISKIFSTGINIKNLHYIIFASGGKAKVKLIQSIGRGLRLHNGKKDLIIIDIADQLKYGIKHSDRRKILYDEEKIKYNITTITEKT
tara:strand:- start:9812 stop:11269 length:1458 start_codon:yes stop_codon:yes gene_type:complete